MNWAKDFVEEVEQMRIAIAEDEKRCLNQLQEQLRRFGEEKQIEIQTGLRTPFCPTRCTGLADGKAAETLTQQFSSL